MQQKHETSETLLPEDSRRAGRERRRFCLPAYGEEGGSRTFSCASLSSSMLSSILRLSSASPICSLSTSRAPHIPGTSFTSFRSTSALPLCTVHEHAVVSTRPRRWRASRYRTGSPRPETLTYVGVHCTSILCVDTPGMFMATSATLSVSLKRDRRGLSGAIAAVDFRPSPRPGKEAPTLLENMKTWEIAGWIVGW